MMLWFCDLYLSKSDQSVDAHSASCESSYVFGAQGNQILRASWEHMFLM